MRILICTYRPIGRIATTGADRAVLKDRSVWPGKRLTGKPNLALPTPKTSLHPLLPQRATERTVRADPSPRSSCWFDSGLVADGPPAFGPQDSARTNGSFSYWLHSHPRKSTGPTTPRPDAQATALFAPPRRAAAVRRRAAFFLQLSPNFRSHKSTVEVPNGRSRRWPNSASVASGCVVTSFSSRTCRVWVRSVLRPHK